MSLIHDFRKIHAIGDLFSRITTIPTLKVCHIFLEKQDEAANTFHANIFFILPDGKQVFCKRLELYLSSDLSLVVA